MLRKVLGINLLVFVAYAMVITLSSKVANKGFNIAIGMGVCIVLHVGITLVAGIVFMILGKRNTSRSLLLSAAILAPIGFFTWLILLSIFG
jgi:uncharacterized membrane protein YozB (DUF420 family)